MFRKTIFWLHLVAGAVGGIVIGIMSITGAALAFEKEIIAFAEREARLITPPSTGSKPLPLDDLLFRSRQSHPDYRPAGLVVSRDPRAAIALSAGGRGGGATASLYANPHTGEIREAQAPRTRVFLRKMNTWHRWLGVEGEHRNISKAVTGACNFAFLFLGISGLYLWWPRSWSRTVVRAVALFNFAARGKARDFNWHNVIGLWSAPTLIVLTATALPISYRWAGDMIYRLTGTEAPAARTSGPGNSSEAPVVPISPRPEGAVALSYDTLVANVQRENPRWELVTLRLGAAIGTGQPIAVTLKEAGSWPRTATTTLSLDPFTGAVLRRETFTDQNLGRRVRTWTRFLHTGEALGGIGQFVAGLASLGACVLVYTGFALAWRRMNASGRKR